RGREMFEKRAKSQIVDLEAALIEYVERYGATRQAKTALSQGSGRKTQLRNPLFERRGTLVSISEAGKSAWHRAFRRGPE
ncbi:MAG: hypothetical protein AAFN63_11475, partial [Pseudomonadota bacterium]